MRRTLYTLALSLLLALPAWSAPPLGDLTISSSRVPDWYIPTIPDTSAWTVINVGTAQGVDCADNATDDGPEIRTAIATAEGQAPATPTIILLAGDSGTPCVFNVGTGIIDIQDSKIVLRGGGAANTSIKFMHDTPAANCGIFPSESGAAFFEICSASNSGTAVNWTAGFTVGTTVLTVANTADFDPAAGKWVRTDACFDANYGIGTACRPDSPQRMRNYFQAKVTARSVSSGAGTITLDRPLIESASDARAQQVVTPFTPVEQVGVEDLTITHYDFTVAANYYDAHVRITMAVDSWFTGVTITDFYNQGLEYANAARNLFAQGKVERCYYHNNNEAAIDAGLGSVQNAIIDNILVKDWQAIRTANSQGNVFAYNYIRRVAGVDGLLEMLACNVTYGADNVRASSTLTHGAVAAQLLEGNDMDCRMMTDDWWGPQASNNFAYRNRVSTGGNIDDGAAASTDYASFGIVHVIQDPDTGPIEFDGSLLLNTASLFAKNFSAFAYDETSYSARDANFWIERNLVQGLLRLVPRADTDSVNNVASSTGPVSWPGVSFPASLVYTSKPSWWTISSPWPAIGADVDTIGGTMHKLPAQCRYEASVTGDCAPYVGRTRRAVRMMQ